MIDVDPVVTAALAGPHRMIPRVTAQLRDQSFGQVVVTEGSVSYDENTPVQSRCQVTIAAPDKVPSSEFDARELDVSGWRLFIEYGVVIGQIVYFVPLGTFVVYDLDDSDVGSIQITGYDTTVLVRDGRFTVPYWIAAGINYQTALSDLCTSINLPSSFPVTNYTTPLLLFPEGDDRLARMNDMAGSLGGSIIADPYGVITMRTSAAIAATDTSIDFIEGPGCKMTALTKRRTRQQVYNAAVYTGEPAGGSPVTGFAYDLDPNSSTYYYGPFGIVPVFEKSQFVTTQAQADAAAQGLMNRKKGIGSTLQITTWANPTLRPGDTAHITRTRMGVDQTVPLSSMSISLVAGRDMSITTREGTVA